MTFTPEQTDALKAPLSRDSIKTREQSGRKLSYIEGWKAIAEANRIFGFDGWNRETIEYKMVAEHQRKVGQGEGWGVTYIAKVRVSVGPIVREGCGTGHGIDRDLGQAHESAIKEAETDAMKRSLMTFGNPFGLALYDKAQEEVEKPAARASSAPVQPKPTPAAVSQRAAAAEAPVGRSRAEIAKEWAEKQIPKIATMTKPEIDLFTTKFRVQIADMPNLDAAASKALDAAIMARHNELFA